MARTIAPLLSFDAGGQIAKTQVYARWKGRSYVRRYTVPANPKTADQTLTRNTFGWLTQVWKYIPGSATAAWDAYADNLRITNRNAWLKANIGPLREQTTLADLTLSPSASGGIAAAAINAVAGAAQITVTLTEPSLPTGWTIVAAFAMAIKDQDPQTDTDYVVVAGTDPSTPYSIVLTGLETAALYRVGGWFQYAKPDGTPAYGAALNATATPT